MFFPRPARPALLLVSGILTAAVACHSRPRPHPPQLSPSAFTTTTLVGSVDTSANTKLLTLLLPPACIPRDPRALAPIWSIFVKDSDIQVERPYTPIHGIDQNGHIKLWVRRYEHGEVARWLHSRQVGDPIEIRGPVHTGSSLWRDGHWDHVVLISAGTGITPFYQLLHSAFRTHRTPSNLRFTLLHASKSVADLPPVDMIQSLLSLSQEYPDRFRLQLFAESIDTPSRCHSLKIQPGRIGKSALQDALQLTHSTPWWRRLFQLSTRPPVPQILVLVCGPEGMVSAIAGPYGRNSSQGEVAGILGELGFNSRNVWKL